MESRRRDAAEDDEDWSERASHRKGGGSGERGKRASEGDRGASVDAGKDEKLPLSSGGGGGVAVSVLGCGVGGIAFFLPFPSSLFPRRKWPLDVTVIILRASLARKNERTREREKERESDARTAAAAPTKMPVGGGREGGEAKGRASERASERVSGWAGCNCSQAREEERGRDWTATGARGQAKRSLLSGLALTFEVLGCRVK